MASGEIPDEVFAPRRKETTRREWKPAKPWYPKPDDPFQNALDTLVLVPGDLTPDGDIPPESPMLDIEFTECGFVGGNAAKILLEVTGTCKLWALLWSCDMWVETYWMRNTPLLVQRRGPADIASEWGQVLVCADGSWRVIGVWRKETGLISNDPLPPEGAPQKPQIWMPPSITPGSANATKQGGLTTIYTWQLVPPVTITGCWATATYQEMVTVTSVAPVGGEVLPSSPHPVEPPAYEVRTYRIPGCQDDEQ